MYVIGGIFIFLIVANFLVFSIKKEKEFKKKYMPFAGILLMTPIVAVPILQFWPSPIFLIPVLGFGVVAFLNLKLTKFCDQCGKFRYNRQVFEKMNFCSVCGEKFGD